MYIIRNLPPSAQFDIFIIMILFFLLFAWSLQSDKMNHSTTNVSPHLYFLSFWILCY